MSNPFDEPQHLPQGAFREMGGGGLWRVWAPRCDRLSLITWPDGERRETAMERDEFGYFVGRVPDVSNGLRYAYRMPDGSERPDPASRWQPDGVDAPSAVFLPDEYTWRDHAWPGIHADELVLYELHVGTFTPEGTFAAIVDRLPELVDLGVTAIELMPIGQFSGERNWGYDGVHPFAAQNTYGGPRALQHLVDAAHEAGLAVFLDVIYNHIGPEGNYLPEFGSYFTDRYQTPWGKAMNFDDAGSDAVRRYVIDNARMWVRDFHIDGLRLDAVHAIYDAGARHVLAELREAAQREAAAHGRIAHIIAETHQNDIRLINSEQRGGYGLDGLWSDDFHHSVHALLTGERDGYYMDFGHAEHLVKSFNDIFVYDGRYSPLRQRCHGRPAGNHDRSRFVVCIQNHDQVGNRPAGNRLSTLLADDAQRLACALMMLCPCTPLLFMGEEYGETHPFPFFCSFSDEALIEAVRRGRRAEFESLAFKWDTEVPDPQDERTFASAKLTWDWPTDSSRRRLRTLYRDLLSARRRWPALRDRQHTRAWLGGPNDRAPTVELADVLVIQRGRTGALIASANLSDEPRPIPQLDGQERSVILSTEAVRYGGGRDIDMPVTHLLPHEVIVYAPGDWRL